MTCSCKLTFTRGKIEVNYLENFGSLVLEVRVQRFVKISVPGKYRATAMFPTRRIIWLIGQIYDEPYWTRQWA